MKKITLLLIFLLIFLTACGSQPGTEASPEDGGALETQLVEKDRSIEDLEGQVAQLTEQLALLQEDYDALSNNGAGESSESPSPFMCENVIDNMRYQNPASAIAVLEGWFAVQPQVEELQGTYSTQFWQNVNSRIHTIRYLSTETGLSETATFLIFFEEAGWRPGLLDMTNQCWVDFPD